MVTAARTRGIPVTVHAPGDLLSGSRLPSYLDTCGTSRGGALLVRPDGHIAWRQNTVSEPPRDLIVNIAHPLSSIAPR